MATSQFKDRNRKSIVLNLPPTSTAFNYHCLRSSRQIMIWISCLQQYIDLPEMVSSGYELSEIPGQFQIKWTKLPNFPNDKRLITCGECVSGCSRCKCGLYKLSCTVFCKCKSESCSNRSNEKVNTVFFKIDKYNIFQTR